MECVEGALKTSLRKDKEMGLKLSPQICLDDNGCLNSQNVASSDDFFVDELLDLSNEEGFEEEDDKGCASISVSAQQLQQSLLISSQNASFSTPDDFSSIPTTELTVPAEDLADEWLSHFVEDSFSEFSAPFPAGVSTLKAKEANGIPGNAVHGGSVQPQPFFKTPVPVKSRSKRTRNGGRIWCLGSPSLTESSSSSTTSSSSSSPPSHWLIYQTTSQNVDSPVILPAKKPKSKTLTENRVHSPPPRRCSHCGVQKTPQWRTGPLGAKTLCNACGVRYKSGRLLPEYRPACSPTFSSELHSNHHRKVLEMRRKKETAGPSSSAVPGF